MAETNDVPGGGGEGNPDGGGGIAGRPGRSRPFIAAGTTAGVATLFLLLRLMAVADWNWGTASSIAETLDFSDALPIVLGTLFAEPTLTGILLAVLLPLAFIELIWPAVDLGRGRTLSELLFPAALLAASVTWLLSFRSLWFVVGALGVGILVVLLRLLWREGVGHDLVGRLLRRLGIASVVGFLVLAVFVDTPWMAHEEITVDGQTHTGYVLTAEAGFIRVLTDEREVLIISSSAITGRGILD
ncbi:hypothetical protein D3I60_00565 [Brevibacterium permense]|uniref:hypothetical protein n=1 Tax=Brevibacterium permense TaxID=234834 RepID=UPI0021D09FF3|nr:hypothetical protein [Brevibacterium permense]MCU4295587.1 hypothetical protein [Brevibacterium permense]